MDLYIRFLIALLVVLGLIAALAYLMRRFGPRGMMALASGRGSRLSVIEVAPLDARRRLVLVRRDNVEHLLLLGATGDLVVEAGHVIAAESSVAPADPAPEARP